MSIYICVSTEMFATKCKLIPDRDSLDELQQTVASDFMHLYLFGGLDLETTKYLI